MRRIFIRLFEPPCHGAAVHRGRDTVGIRQAGKKNARTVAAQEYPGIPQCQRDSRGTDGVVGSVGIFLDKIFLTGRAVVQGGGALLERKRPTVSRLLFLWGAARPSSLDYAVSAGGNLPRWMQPETRERDSVSTNLSFSVWFSFLRFDLASATRLVLAVKIVIY